MKMNGQVKKFEAPTMTGALQMVKESLGPNAVILSTKDMKNRGGLAVGVQVMATLSGDSLCEKLTFEKKSSFLQEPDKGKLIDSSEGLPKKTKGFTRVPYIQISEDEKTKGLADGIQKAAHHAYAASAQLEDPREEVRPLRISEKAFEGKGLGSLQNEVTHLKSLISHFQKVPQNFLSLHPGAESGIPYEMSPVFDKLVQTGINTNLAAQIMRRARKSMSPQYVKNQSLVEAWVVKYLLESTVCVGDCIQGTYHIFVGPAGHGKTSSLVKLAGQMVASGHKSIGIVAADHTKIGAVEQLRTYAKILNIDFAHVKEPGDWPDVRQRFSQLSCVFVDLPGSSSKNCEYIFDLVEGLSEGSRRVHYVQSVLSREVEIRSGIKLLSGLGIDDLIFTRLDESVQHGVILNIQKEYGLPLYSFGIGPCIPEDLELATQERIVDLIFKLTEIKGKEVGQ